MELADSEQTAFRSGTAGLAWLTKTRMDIIGDVNELDEHFQQGTTRWLDAKGNRAADHWANVGIQVAARTPRKQS